MSAKHQGVFWRLTFADSEPCVYYQRDEAIAAIKQIRDRSTVALTKVTVVSRRWRVGIVQCRVWRDERSPRWCPKWLWTADGLVSFAGSSSTYQNAIDTVTSVVRGMQ